MKAVLVVRDFSTKLLARETGLAIRAELAMLLADGATVEVDLDGVEDITLSVADECFGKIAQRLGGEKYRKRIQFRGGIALLHRLIDTFDGDYGRLLELVSGKGMASPHGSSHALREDFGLIIRAA